jgi:pseudouridine-5'-phosphate glycosidase
MTTISISTEVRDTLASNGAVVALESTIFSNLGLPSPARAASKSEADTVASRNW